MRSLIIGLLFIVAFAPYVVWADSSAAAAAASAASDDDEDAAAAAAAAAAAEDDDDGAAAAAAAAAAATDDGSAAAAAAAAAADDGAAAAAAAAAAADDGAAAAAAAAAADDDAAAAAAAAAATGNGAAAAAAAAASSSQGPAESIYCNCPLIYKPVCGSDGSTYSNVCVLRCVSYENQRRGGYPIFVYRQGVCPAKTCSCTKIYKPVCGTDNKTYNNECYLDCENSIRIKNGLCAIKIAYRGACTTPTCICPRCIIPVCGTDGKTYRNVCILQCYSRANQANNLPPIYVKKQGACKKETCICPSYKKEICASDGNTYLNDCVFNCQNRRLKQLGQPLLTIKYRGKCINCVCPAVVAPVCANNDVTFTNKCQFFCENKRRQNANLPPLYMRWDGNCDCNCNKRWQPVCASNYNTIQNRCVLRCQNRKRVQDGLYPLSILRDGPCYMCDCRRCGIERRPVCGNDYRTYWNECWLLCNAKCRARANLPRLWKRYNGECWGI